MPNKVVLAPKPHKNRHRQGCRGFSLIELMIALTISLILLAGSILAYSSISHTITTSKQLENAQEVLRYTSQVFSRSLKQTAQVPVVDDANQLVIAQEANLRSCQGNTPNAPYTETYSFVSPNLLCDTGNGAQVILTGVEAIGYAINGLGVRVTITPTGLPARLNNGVQIEIALIRVIFQQATGQ